MIRAKDLSPKRIGAHFLGIVTLTWVVMGGQVSGKRVAAGASGLSPLGQTSANTLPAGTVIWLRLETPVSTKASHLNGAISARVVRGVPGPTGIAIPLGSQVQGHLDKVIPSSGPADRARARMRFTLLDIPGVGALHLVGHVTEIDNARESVLQDGTIQGVLAGELPLTHLENALGKLGKSSGEVQKAEQKVLGKSDTSIDYPSGADLMFVLDKALAVDRAFPPAVPDQLSPAARAAVERLLSDAPQRAAGKDGSPGDPLNLVVIGNATEIRKTFHQAGWSEAEAKNAKSIVETVRAIAGNQGYGAAPVSQLYLYGRHEDLAFEKMLNTFAKRHHLRLWRSPATAPGGREIWLGAATHDTGIDVRPGVISHAIDPDLDAERAKVGADLAVPGLVASERLVARADPLREGTTATGAPWRTDGNLLAIEFKPQE